MKPRSFLLVCVLSLLIHPSISGAQWAADGNALCTATGTQSYGGVISDGAGGAIVVWADNRSGNSDIYAQRVNGWGVVQWTADGVGVRVGTSAQANPVIAPDGGGGAIIFFTHLANNGSRDIYAQHINPSGVKQWATDGVLICGAQNEQHTMQQAVSDGADGAIVAWLDNRDGDFSTADLYARRINSSGVAQWTTDGVAICTAANAQSFPVLVGDGAGGAIIAWPDFRDGLTYSVYARRVDSAGVAQWTADGVLLGTNTSSEAQLLAITTDGAGGAIVTWQTNIISPFSTDVYAQRINASGSLLWTPGGVVVGGADNHQTQQGIVSDGAGGAIIAWMDDREGIAQWDDIYAQRVNASGVAQWTPNGVALCTADEWQIQPDLVSDGAHGAIVCWYDKRNAPPGNNDVYARRITAAGAALWATDGVPVSLAASTQFRPTIVTDGFGGAIAVWDDYRNGGTADIYANRVTLGGVVPTAVGDTPAMPSIAVSNYPNPFSTATVIEITMDREAHVSVDVFDVAGRRVRAMNVGRVGAGARLITFDSRDERGKSLPSGLYFYRVRAGDATVTRKMVIQR